MSPSPSLRRRRAIRRCCRPQCHAAKPTAPPTRILRRTPLVQPAHHLSDEEKFFSDSPPPPPRRGCPADTDAEVVSETPDPTVRRADLRRAPADLTGGAKDGPRTSRSSGAESMLPARHRPLPTSATTTTPPPPPRHDCIFSLDVTAERRIHSKRKPNPRKIWRPRLPHAMPAASYELEPGWTPAKR
jgi:hypothetical protein